MFQLNLLLFEPLVFYDDFRSKLVEYTNLILFNSFNKLFLSLKRYYFLKI